MYRESYSEMLHALDRLNTVLEDAIYRSALAQVRQEQQAAGSLWRCPECGATMLRYEQYEHTAVEHEQ